MIEYNIFKNALHKIALNTPNPDNLKGFKSKKPAISFKENPKNYKGLNDTYYGTAYRLDYLKPFNAYFMVLDIDNYKNTEYNILDAIPEEALETHTVKTGSGGMHLYYLSRAPRSIKQNLSIPLDLKGLTESAVKNGKYGGLIVANYCYAIVHHKYYTDYYKKFYRHDNQGILEINSFDNLVKEIYNNLGVKTEKQVAYDPVITNKVYTGDADLESLYEVIYKIFEKNINSKHMNTYRLNCRLHFLNDIEKKTICNWLIKDFGDCMEDIENFKHEFLKRS